MQPSHHGPSRRRFDIGRVVVASLWPPVTLFGSSLILGLLLGISLAAADLDPAILFSEDNSNQLFLIALNGFVSVAALGLTLLSYPYLLKGYNSLKQAFALMRAPAWRDLALTLLTYVGYMATTVLVLGAVIELVPGFNAQQEQETGFAQPTDLLGYAVAFIGLVVLPPIFEELIFRGFMYSALRRYLSFIATSLIVSVTFGIAHGQWNVGIDTFVLSMFLCLLREKTGAIWAPILLHALKNGTAYVFLFVIGTGE